MKRSLMTLIVFGQVAAGGTKQWSLSSFKDFNAGEPAGTRIGSTGTVSPGLDSKRINVTVQSIWSAARGEDGTLWLGTGDEGKILKVSGEKVEEFAELEAVLVPALVYGKGTLYAGALPGGQVYAMDKTGKVSTFADLEAEHIWALHFDHKSRTLFVATGPEGKLFAIDAAGKARVHFESKQKHLLSLVSDGRGGLYVGSSDEAILYHVSHQGRSYAVHDFPGHEVRALARLADGTLFAAVNELEKPKGGIAPSPRSNSPTGAAAVRSEVAKTTAIKGKGFVFRRDPSGTVEELHKLDKGIFHSLAVASGSSVLAGSAPDGRVFAFHADYSVDTVLDLQEQHVLTILGGKDEYVVGTGDGGALYRVSAKRPATPVYLSKVLDAKYISDWGVLRWRATGALEMSTRSGNTQKPDDSWSGWNPIDEVARGGGGAYGRVMSTPARYLQFRASWTQASAATLKHVLAYYRPRNQRARVTAISLDKGKNSDDADDTDDTTRKPREPILKFKWKVDEADGDPLVYRLFFREESEVAWRKLSKEEPLSKAEFSWNTESIADGIYRLKVVASDERANAELLATEHFEISEPILVDNRKPQVDGLTVDATAAAGRAADSYSPIHALDYAIDSGEWRPLLPRDGILDERVESFHIDLPKLEAGSHTLAVRATDAAGNIGVTQAEIRVP